MHLTFSKWYFHYFFLFFYKLYKLGNFLPSVLNEKKSKVIKYGWWPDPNHQPKASVFDYLEMRLNNQLSFFRITCCTFNYYV